MRFLILLSVAASSFAIECGKPPIKPDLIDLSILGGQEAVPGSWPWQVGIFRKNLFSFGRGTHFCAGALIDNVTVITAAHCLQKKPQKVTIYLGSHFRNAEIEGEQYVDAAQFCLHPDYADNENDIGIIRLAKPVKFTKTVQPICLPEANEEVADSDRFYVTGWGFTSAGADRKQSEVLKQSRQQPITKEACEELRPVFAEKLICASHELGSSCHGDSGGPLQSRKNGRWELRGVVSGGPPVCGMEDWPMYYTEVSKFIEWFQAYKQSSDPSTDESICGDFS